MKARDGPETNSGLTVSRYKVLKDINFAVNLDKRRALFSDANKQHIHEPIYKHQPTDDLRTVAQ